MPRSRLGVRKTKDKEQAGISCDFKGLIKERRSK